MLKILKSITSITLSLSLLNPVSTVNNINGIDSNISIPGTQREVIQVVQSYSTCYTEGLNTNENLQEYATKFLKDNYNINLEIPVTFKSIGDNNILGQFYYNKGTNKPVEIIINDMILSDDNYCQHQVERTLRHELVHYYLNSTNQEFRDGQETFEVENFKQGGRSNSGAKANYLNTRIMVSCCD